jgi:Tfp pilus assembly protein PilV
MNRVQSIRKRLGDESGFTLIELLVAGMITVALLGTLGYLFVIAQRNQPEIADRSDQIQRGRVAVESLTRDIREAYSVNGTPTASQLSVNTFVRHTSCGATTFRASTEPSIACRVTYTCTAGACVRVEANPDGSNPGSAVRVVDGLESSNVFDYQEGASGNAFVDVTLVFPSEREGESVTIADGAELRNE